MSESRAAAIWYEVVDAAPVAIVLLDAQGQVIHANTAAEGVLGHTGTNLTGVAFDDLVAGIDQDDVTAQLSKVVMGTAPATHLDGIRTASESGGGPALTLDAVRLDDDDEASVAVYLFAAPAPRMDAELLQAQKLQALGQLAGGVAHDFNNLLTAILGFTDLLLAQPQGADARTDLEQVRRNAQRGSRLVAQLLAFSRRQAQQPVVLSANVGVGDLTKMLGRLLGATVDLDLDLKADPDSILMDPGHFDQMMINLAVNARDAMPRGGHLMLATANDGDGWVRIAVSDTGVGIAKEILGDIFDPFFTTKDPAVGGGVDASGHPGGGTGLGLSTVHGIVHQAGGSIRVDSAPGRGTTFTIRLPGVDAKPEADHRPKPEPTELTAGATVLLVEDEDAVRQFAARALAARGHRVLQAESGEVALDLLGELVDETGAGAIDLLVTDVVMPGVDGYTLSRLVREERPELKVVLMSGYAHEAVSPDLESGAAVDPDLHFLPKPFSLAQLCETVDAVLSEL